MKKNVHRSRAVILVTILFMTILIAADIYLIILMGSHKMPYILNAILITILSATIFCTYIYAPRSIVLTDTALVLYRGVGKKVIYYSDISEINIYNSEGVVVRVCGIGGVFGYIGRYYNKKIGYYFSYVGDYSQTFYIQQKNGKKYVFSCDDRDYVVFYLKKRLEHL